MRMVWQIVLMVWGGGWQREQILTIMQDSRIGTYGAIALFFILFAKYQALNALSITDIPFVLIAGHAISRLFAVWIMATLNYAKPSGKAKPLATDMRSPALLLANLFGLLPFFGLVALLIHRQHSTSVVINFVLITLIPMALIGVWWRYKMKRWLDGYTGDTLGAMQQMTELMFYIGLVLWGTNN
jgi:adenosylcobinamide-GDP ribazoletransferase